MLFTSIDFLVFFVVVILVYFYLPFTFRNFFLLSGSCFFYMFFKPEYILILAATIILDFFLAKKIEQTSSRHKKNLLLIVSIFSNLSVLLIFKYYNFINENFTFILSNFGFNNPLPFLKIALPIGLSFHTFQAISYIIEVSRKNQIAERNLITYALYVMFFPQLVAGPIERPQNILYQFKEEHRPNILLIKRGIMLIIWGLFKKIVIADRLAFFVDKIYDYPDHFHAPLIITGTLFFSIQIYCDFSGYSDIAIGTASILGFRLVRNFDRPYLSMSVIDFWRKWHISLSTWFRDYVYIPLGGGKKNRYVTSRNTLVVFTLSGLWHGASWNFIIWGTLHGIIVSINHLINGAFPAIRTMKFQYLKICITFCITSFCWIFFRSATLKDSIYIISNIFRNWRLEHTIMEFQTEFKGMNKHFLIAVFSICLLFIFELNQTKILTLFNQSSVIIKFFCCYLIIISIVIFGFYKSDNSFIYFQF
ncbi:MBOAT family protein [Pedobacter sp. BMA]|uniref:MBOAT family O-acyltransferase n=1 Tax=Pedobacter sp. BMA TaxID=1663685 RepID=UPI00064AB7AB|nr:MBOAT family O-acyltransferase [Pedobacter sp. BMA]KLT66627.1 hypothetical protein AB669_05495 [Pedobacter sp. BMA]